LKNFYLENFRIILILFVPRFWVWIVSHYTKRKKRKPFLYKKNQNVGYSNNPAQLTTSHHDIYKG